MLHPILLIGGFGTRLWPLSRALMPKQFLPLITERSMVQETLQRLDGLPETAAPVVICNNDHRFLTAEQLHQIGVTPQALMLEPARRNTAPAIAAAALQVLAGDLDALLLVLPSDHVIANVAEFHVAIGKARELAERGFLVTFGVVPNAPETGYGYIRRGAPLKEPDGTFTISQFVEKPDAETAQGYLSSGEYFWNSGMFLFRAQDYLDELSRHQPAMLEACKTAVQEAQKDLDFLRLSPAFATSPADSIDYAVMEKTERAAVVAVDIGWNDIGSWASLWEYLEKDAGGNIARGEVLLEDVANSYVQAESRMVAAVGVEDLVIVETRDAVLVAHRSKSQDVKAIVERLQAAGRTEHENHTRVYRPWGSYEGMDQGDRFQVKRLTVNPGARLSLQMHHHRSEHWVVVQGTAEVTIGDKVHLLSEDQSIYVPLGAHHRLHNPGRIPLHLVEVQSGSYLGEDDIVRIEDTYGR